MNTKNCHSKLTKQIIFEEFFKKQKFYFAIPLFLFLFFIFTFSTFSLEAQPISYEEQRVAKIEIINAAPGCEDTFDSYSILARLKTKENDLFSQLEFDQDLKTLATEFDQVQPSIESRDDQIYIHIKLWPKPTIRSIQWYGNCRIESKTLQEELGICLFTVFDRAEFNKAFQKIRSYYIKKGFFEANIDYRINRDPLCNDVDIEIIINEGRSGRIKDIIFHNFTCEEEKDLTACMVSQKWNFFLSWLTEDGTYRDEAILQDEYVILNYLQNEGYSDAKVQIEIEDLPCENRIIIHIIADKGKQYFFGPVKMEGNCIFSKDELYEQFTFTAGSPYSPDALRETVANLMSLYGRYGYIDAYIDYEPRLLPDRCEYAVDFFVTEGEAYCVGLIKVFGNCSTQTNVILHETLLVPGEVFNGDKLKMTEERLMNTRFFKTVNVYAVKTDDECILGSNYRDVHIEVEETSTGSFGISLGFSSADSIFGGFNIGENNFNWRGLGTLGTKGLRGLRGGGEYVHFNAIIGRKNTTYVFSWTKPYFMDTLWSVGFDLEQMRNRSISRHYDISAYGGSIFAKYQCNAFLRFGWHYRLRHTSIHVHEDCPPESLRKEERNHGVISASGVSLTYDSTDSIRCPRSGVRSVLSTELAGLGGNYGFLGINYLNTFYYPVGECGTLKYRFNTRFIKPIRDDADHIPLSERLFLGGEETVRGYRPYAIGPVFDHDDADPKGGMSLALLSMEYNYPLFSRLDAFVFCDMGHLSFKEWDLIGEFKVSVGYGIRLKIIDCGPAFILGMGYPLNAHKSNEVQRFFFSIGTGF